LGEGFEEVRSAVAELQAQVARLEGRVAELEGRRRRAVSSGAPAGQPPAAVPVPALPQGGLALAGRTLLVLAGAYLFRALTEAGALPALAGVLLGLAYAVVWQLRALGDARSGRRGSALAHGLAASAVAFPLVWEAVARFRVLPAAAAAAAVAAFAALGLLTAFRHHLTANAWLTTLAACATVLALLVPTHDPVSALVALVALAVLVEWLAFRDTWLGLRWSVAATLDAVAVQLVAIGARPEPPAAYARLDAPAAAAVLVALPLVYVGGIAARTLRRGCPVRLFEAVQGTLAVALGLGGARRVLAAHGLATSLPALLAVALGMLCYAVAFVYAERRRAKGGDPARPPEGGQGRNFYFYSAAGGLLMLGGTLELGLGAALPLVWAGLGSAGVTLGRRFGRTTLRVHGALYLAAAAAAAGLAAAGLRALFGGPAFGLPPLAWVVALGAAAGLFVLASDRDGSASGTPLGTRLSRLLLALVVVLSLAEAAHVALAAGFGPALTADAGLQAVTRSAVLAALVLALAWLARRALPELAALVYALLGLGGLKLLLHDMQAGRPATLVASFAVYGSLLILVPRLLAGPKRPD
jgi:hypothetical protein